MAQEVWLWILSSALGVLGAMIAVIWSLLRAEQKAQDDAIEEVRKHKADKEYVEDIAKRSEKEIDRSKFEHERAIDRIETRHERDIQQMEARLGLKLETMELNVLRQVELVAEMLKGRIDRE